jgi:hypothetical protein
MAASATRFRTPWSVPRTPSPRSTEPLADTGRCPPPSSAEGDNYSRISTTDTSNFSEALHHRLKNALGEIFVAPGEIQPASFRDLAALRLGDAPRGPWLQNTAYPANVCLIRTVLPNGFARIAPRGSTMIFDDDVSQNPAGCFPLASPRPSD